MKTISFVIPVYNEEKRIDRAFTELTNGISLHGLKLEKIIFVNDGSHDKTISKIINQKSKIENHLKTQVAIVSYQKHQGKGYAIKTGMKVSDSDYTLFFDADMSTPLTEIDKFRPYFERGTDIIVGTRKNGQSTVLTHQPFYRELLGHGFTYLANIILDTRVSDFTCGFKAFSKKAKVTIFNQSKMNSWSYDAETLYLGKKYGYSLVEQAVQWSNVGQSRVNLVKDLPKTILDLVKIRLHTYSSKSININTV